jgi:hypothetical protein
MLKMSHEGAKRAAMFYSFFGTCKKNNDNPYLWLKKVQEVIPRLSRQQTQRSASAKPTAVAWQRYG